MKKFTLFLTAGFTLLAAIACSNQNKKTSLSLTEEQQTVCDFIIQIFGNPNDEFISPFIHDSQNPKWIDYATQLDLIWGKGGVLASHCSESLVKSIESRSKDDNVWKNTLGAKDADAYGFNKFQNVFLIVVDEDWYTYYAFQGGGVLFT